MNLSVWEKKFRNLMVIYFFLFIGGGIIFYLRPDKVLGDIITLGTWLGFDDVQTVEDKYWVILSVGLMMTIAACCFMASLKVPKTMHYAIPMLVGKLTTSGIGLHEFITASPHRFHYLVIFLVDFPLFALALLYYIRALRNKGDMGREFVYGEEIKEAAPVKE